MFDLDRPSLPPLQTRHLLRLQQPKKTLTRRHRPDLAAERGRHPAHNLILPTHPRPRPPNHPHTVQLGPDRSRPKPHRRMHFELRPRNRLLRRSERSGFRNLGLGEVLGDEGPTDQIRVI